MSECNECGRRYPNAFKIATYILKGDVIKDYNQRYDQLAESRSLWRSAALAGWAIVIVVVGLSALQ